MLDRVVELVPGEYAIAEKDILETLDVFRGHFPGHPVFPGVLQLEAPSAGGSGSRPFAAGGQGQDRSLCRSGRCSFPAASGARRCSTIGDPVDKESR